MTEFNPETEPGTALVPPGRVPPTAVATATPPSPVPQHRRSGQADRQPGLFRIVRRAVVRALDLADSIALTVRTELLK